MEPSRLDTLVIRKGKRGFYWKRVAPNGEPVGNGEPYARLDGVKKGALRSNPDLDKDSIVLKIPGYKPRKTMPKPEVVVAENDVAPEVEEPADAVVPPVEWVVPPSSYGGETFKRTVRTLLWAVIALAPAIATGVALLDLSAATTAKVAGAMTVLVTFVTWLANALEEAGWIPKILKS